MTTDSSPERAPVHTTIEREPLLQERCSIDVAKRKERQSRKIREIRDALVTAGYLALDEQAKVLGLSRSTTWTVVKGDHKSSGLSAAVISRMLAAPRLPLLVRAKIREYVKEKAAGSYGHGEAQRRRFAARLSPLARGGMDCEKEVLRLQAETRTAVSEVPNP